MTAEDYIGLAIWAVRDVGYLPGGTVEDLRQEAMIGLVEAVRDYQPDKGTFPTFVVLCARRRAIDAIKHATRRSRLLLSDAVRRTTDDDGYEVDIVDTLTTGRTAEDEALLAVELADTLTACRRLSPFERRALLGTVAGYEYAEIGDQKSVDNALQRARVKLRATA